MVCGIGIGGAEKGMGAVPAVLRSFWVGVLAAMALVSIGWGQDPVRVADAVCAGCHREITERYLRTPMAHASGRATEHLLPGAFTQATSGVRYRVYGEGGKAYFGFEDGRDARVSGRRELQYFLGSGHLGVTYLYEQEGYLLETPVAWYAAAGGYDMKPGYGRTREMPAALPMEATCLRCHMSGVRATESGSVNRYPGAPFAHTGITCEGCHGEAAAHVRTGGKAAVVNPVKLDAERRDGVCLSCHLEGDVTVKRAGRSVLDYRPGERIGDYLAYYVVASNDPLARGVSEVEQMAASRCKRASGDRMSCMSCHDPHGDPGPAERVSFYRAKCLACHSGAAFAETHHPENRDCTGCHMPRSSAEDVPHVAWTDHRILRGTRQASEGSGLALSGVADSRKEKALTAIFSPEADARDGAMARYAAVMRGVSEDRGGTLAGLRQVYGAGSRDVAVLEALGVMDALAGEATEAEARLRELLTKDPTNVTAISDLAIYLARRGDLQEAVHLWERAFGRNADDMGMARNLALTQCAMGDAAGAKRTMKVGLEFSPGTREGWDFACEAGRR